MYRLYILDGFDGNSNLTFDEVKNIAKDYHESDNITDLFKTMVGGINSDTMSDQDWFYVVDEENGIILFS
jgi:hypothetical protein